MFAANLCARKQKNMKKIYLPLVTFFALSANAQEIQWTKAEDTTRAKELSEVVVTATRTERKLTNVAVPVRIINQTTIQQAGSLRLRDILQEQAGLYLTNGFGAGVQMQGLNPDYTLIMIDGEPLVGRTAGVLDLNRVAVGNVKKIEIVKGPSSSLYGSEAMAGVINIITDNSFKKKLSAGIRYGFGNPDDGWALPGSSKAFNNTDMNLQGSATIKNKLGIQYFSNANFLDAISYRPNSTDRVPQPVWRLTNQLQLSYPFSPKTKATLSVRHAWDHIKQNLTVDNIGSSTSTYGYESNKDLNINGAVTHQFNDHIKTALRLYATQYNGLQRLFYTDKPDSVYNDVFKQHFYRAENQTDFNWGKSTITAGAGYAIDQVNSTRYDDVNSRKQNNIAYAFAQEEWRPTEKLTVIGGIRYDDNKLFAAAVSPKVAIRYAVNSKLSLRASLGRGFKAPDFRQLYLNFTNIAAGGYSVFGTIDAVKIIDHLNQEGQIADLTADYSKLKQLTPEFSTGANLGGTYNPIKNLVINFNAFRNDIENLIDVREVATRINGTQIYSYINVKNAYTEGGELEVKYDLNKKWQVNAGYQYLVTADKDELKKVKAGEVYTTGANGSRVLKTSEYRGLPNRSTNMANFKITYDYHGVFFTARVLYRSKWIVAKGGSQVNDINSEYANGFAQLNLSTGHQLKNGFRMIMGMDNVFNYQDVNNLPNLPGRMIYIGAQFRIIQ